MNNALNGFAASACIMTSFGIIIAMRLAEARHPLHVAWISGDIVVVAKIASDIRLKCRPNFRPSATAGTTQFLSGDPFIDEKLVINEKGNQLEPLRSCAVQDAIKIIYALAPQATIKIAGRRVNCYVNDPEYRYRTVNFSILVFKEALLNAVSMLAVAIDDFSSNNSHVAKK